MIVGTNKEVWAQSLLSKHRDLLEEFQGILNGATKHCFRSDTQIVPNILNALEALAKETTFKPEVAASGMSSITSLSDDPRLCLKEIVQAKGFATLKTTIAFHLKENQITQKLHDDLLACFKEISVNIESIFLFQSRQGLAIRFPTKEDSILFIESLGKKQFYPLSDKQYPAIDKDDPRIVSIPASLNMFDQLVVNFPNDAIRSFVYHTLDLKEKITFLRESAMLFNDKETFNKGNSLRVGYASANSALQLRKRLLDTLSKDDVDAVTKLIEEGENGANTYLDEFELKDSQDPAQKAMQQQKECLYYALARWEDENALDASLEKSIFERILANSQKSGPYRQKDQRIILNNLMGDNYSALPEGPLKVDAIKLDPLEFDEVRTKEMRSRLLILIYAYDLEEMTILNKQVGIISGLSLGINEVFNAKTTKNIRKQVLDKIKELEAEIQTLKGSNIASTLELPAASHDAYELAILALKLQTLVNQRNALKGDEVMMQQQVDDEEAKKLETDLIAGKEKIIADQADAAKKMEEQNKAIAAKINQKNARHFAKREPIMTADIRLTASSILVSAATFVGLIHSSWFALLLLKESAVLGAEASAIAAAVSPTALAISVSLGLVCALALGPAVYYGYRQYANFKRDLPERYKHNNVEASIQIDRFARLFTNDEERACIRDFKQLRKRVPHQAFADNKPVEDNLKLHRLEFKQFEIKAYKKLFSLKGDAREKAKQECIAEAKKRFSL
ncbi:MAG: hypothetical protein JSS07_11920 [Proteobacteria bacterium]|nr:hypothetical protein [Pseudomonadota bacterium]